MPSNIPNNPSISNVRAIITTRWGMRGYRPATIRAIESYFVDTALDNDSDGWQLVIADPHGDRLEMFQRDSEIRVEIFGVGHQGVSYIMNGIADEASYDDQGSITIMGRDYSSLATDSTAPPWRYRLKAAHQVIQTQAGTLNFPAIDLSKAGKRSKVIYTDGSESYWEFWYRLLRKDKQFLWCDSRGALLSGVLNYHSNPVYFFGSPARNDPKSVRPHYIPVERLEINKNLQRRFANVWVFGQRGEQGFLERESDSSMKLWVKKSRKIMFDASITSPKAAVKAAQEEIFEGKVGSFEIKVTIADPGIMIRQNRIAKVNIPEIGLTGEYFVVGSKIQCGESGFVQEVRLREKQFAISQRIPQDPKLVETRAPTNKTVSGGLAVELAERTEMPEDWGPYFINAAKEFCGPWDYNLFLATLLGICDQESSFTNKREIFTGNPTVQWYPPPQTTAQEAHRHGEPAGRTLDEWHALFANSGGNPLNPFRSRGSNAEAGVGPMQLTSVGLKEWADDYFKPNFRNEYIGGRWHPEHNIRAGARYLRNCLKEGVRDSGRTEDMWAGVSAYNAGHVVVGSAYSTSVKNKVLHDPGYLEIVTDSVKAAREAAKAAKDGQSDYSRTNEDGSYELKGMPTKSQTISYWNAYTNPNFEMTRIKREAVVYAAMFARWQRPFPYAHDGVGLNPKELGPPPNVPSPMDCSWFAYWCYKSAGYDLPGTWTGPQWAGGRSISFNQLQWGDLVFYGHPSQPGAAAHVAVYIGYGKVASMGSDGGPWIEEVKYRSDLAGYRSYLPRADTSGGDTSGNGGGGGGSGSKKVVMIQAGHDPGNHSDQPYGHAGQSGAPGEVDFTKAVRGYCLGYFNKDSRFAAAKGTAWSASAGASAATSDDINFHGDIFIAIHYDANTGAGSRYFFGWPTGRGSAVLAASQKLRDEIISEYNQISGHPTRNAGMDNSNEALYGYYAYGHPSRSFPDNVDHTTGVNAKVLIECGEGGTGGVDRAWLLGHQQRIGLALYRAVCNYYGYNPRS